MLDEDKGRERVQICCNWIEKSERKERAVVNWIEKSEGCSEEKRRRRVTIFFCFLIHF